MLSPKYQRYADRLRALDDEGRSLTEPGSPLQPNPIKLHAWLEKVGNILNSVFGPQSLQVKHFTKISLGQNRRPIEIFHDILAIMGILRGALDDLAHGFLTGQEFLIAGDVFDSVLEQAKHLVNTGYKDPAAVLARVVLEDALKRIARVEGIDDTLKATRLNDELKKADRYPQPQWRLIQAWLDIGNAAAHGKFDEYTADDVKNAINGIEQFLATELRI